MSIYLYYFVFICLLLFIDIIIFGGGSYFKIVFKCKIKMFIYVLLFMLKLSIILKYLKYSFIF